MTETQERFLRAVAERVPLDRVAEVYLFPPIRQGGDEAGLAVVATEPEELPLADGAGATAVAPALAVVEGLADVPPQEANDAADLVTVPGVGSGDAAASRAADVALS